MLQIWAAQSEKSPVQSRSGQGQCSVFSVEERCIFEANLRLCVHNKLVQQVMKGMCQSSARDRAC